MLNNETTELQLYACHAWDNPTCSFVERVALSTKTPAEIRSSTTAEHVSDRRYFAFNILSQLQITIMPLLVPLSEVPLVGSLVGRLVRLLELLSEHWSVIKLRESTAHEFGCSGRQDTLNAPRVINVDRWWHSRRRPLWIWHD
jgi:hypothetical protein